MNGSPAVCGKWTRGRFWRVFGVLCVVQVGLIWLFGGRERGLGRTAPVPGHFGLVGTPLTAGELTRTFFAIDPTVFPMPSLHGFSERAWLRLPTYQLPDETEPPAWLTLNTNRLGIDFPPSGRAEAILPSALTDQSAPELDPWPASLAPERVRTNSLFEIEGELAGRLLNAPGGLPSWPSTLLLANSVVQIAVDSAGQVVAARLLAPRSGSAEADNTALALARQLRFRPVPSPAPVWGKAVFDWQTLEPTNAGPAAAQ
ncbi:MAG: energy transducer TonB [Limisphaerales bacterium]